jgi:hypothetical protein
MPAASPAQRQQRRLQACPCTCAASCCCAAFLFFKGVNGFNEAAERQDKIDGYIE